MERIIEWLLGEDPGALAGQGQWRLGFVAQYDSYVKLALIAATERDTLPILGSLHNTLRAWKNAAALRVAELEAGQGDMWEILPLVAGTETRRMIDEGEVQAGVIACSQSIGIVEEIKPVAEIIEGMVKGAETIRGGLGAA